MMRRRPCESATDWNCLAPTSRFRQWRSRCFELPQRCRQVRRHFLICDPPVDKRTHLLFDGIAIRGPCTIEESIGVEIGNVIDVLRLELLAGDFTSHIKQY